MDLNLNARQLQIIEIVTKEQEVKVADLKETFGVTEMTIRRDLEKLEKCGYLHRTFGGAIANPLDVSLRERSGLLIHEKIRIGKKAASSIQKGESIFIDGGSTTLQVAKHIQTNSEITVVTNALNIAEELLNKKIPTIVTGGQLVEETSSLVGPIAVDTIGKVSFDRVFLGATGLSIEHGFCNSNFFEAEVKRIAMQRAVEVNVVLDHTKFGERALVSFADLNRVDRIYTDQFPSNDLLNSCQEAGTTVIEC